MKLGGRGKEKEGQDQYGERLPNSGEMELEVNTSSRETWSQFEAGCHATIFKILIQRELQCTHFNTFIKQNDTKTG